MTDRDGLEGLHGLHQDLISLSKSQLRNVDRIWTELNARVDEFRRLLDKPKKNEPSRQTLLSGTNLRNSTHEGTNGVFLGNVKLDEDEYAVNEEFQESATQLADTLDLDEVESTRLLLEAQEHAELLDRPILSSAIIRFQQRRQYLLECLRLTLTYATDSELEDDIRTFGQELVGSILETKDGPIHNSPVYVQKCLQAMCDIESWLQQLGDRVQGTIALGQILSPDSDEIIAFQQQSLTQQHESLAAIINLLVKASYSTVEDFYKLLERLSKLDRWNVSAVHYVPIILAFISRHGSPEGNGMLREARLLNNSIMDSQDTSTWTLRHLHAATQTWWLAEYSGWYQDPQASSPVESDHFEAEALGRSDAFFTALKEGAFQCTLTLCSQLTPYEWYDPARESLISYLLRDAPQLPQDMVQTSEWFRSMLMKQLESFVDAFITNMPDTLRHFKSEEDDQRKRIHSNLQPTVRGGGFEQDLHLERFLVVISFAYDGRIEAAQSFWSDADSNLYGFLQWVSKRQSTPCVGAFCEMLRSISKSGENATCAHRFLLEEASVSAARVRRYGSLSWAQILAELNIYTSKIREQPQADRPTSLYSGKTNPDHIDEPESVLMLESYLRLISHLCTESSEARSWVLSQSNPHILDTLLYLCNATVPSRLQACAFIMMRALITHKLPEISVIVWVALDSWTSGAYASSNSVRPAKLGSPAAWSKELTFNSITSSFDQANEFTALLRALMGSTEGSSALSDQLSFPENLGSSYRTPGVEPFIDLVLDKIFATMAPQLEEPLKNRVLSYNVLDFVAVCLSTFNEDLLVLANKLSLSVDEAINASSLSSYVRLHPFCRTMDWLFNERVLFALFAASHKGIDEISAAPPDSPVVLSLVRSIEVMNLIVDLQSTYLNIVRPLVKDELTGRRRPVFNPSLASFEDSVALNLQLIVDLCLYSGIGNQDLAVCSLKLLGKLASSRRLNIHSTKPSSGAPHSNRLIGIVEQEDDLDRISRSFNLAMQFDSRELELGPESSGWTIKSVILEFLFRTLAASPNKPTLAHALLGFSCRGTDIEVDPEGLFANGLSLFHAVLQLVVDYPDGDEVSMRLWALSLRQMGMEVLSILWRSPLSSVYVFAELRANDMIFRLFSRQISIDSETAWEERSLGHPDFAYSESAEAFQQYLWQRQTLYDYASVELRLVAKENAPSLKARIYSALLGSSYTPEGEQISNPTIFDLLDFVELNVPHLIDNVQYNYFTGIDFAISADTVEDSAAASYNLKLVEEMLALRLNEIRRTGGLRDSNEEQQAIAKADQILRYFRGANNVSGLGLSRKRALSAWTDLMTLAIDVYDFDEDGRALLMLQALQLLTPKLETFTLENDSGAIAIAGLVRALIFQYGFGLPASEELQPRDVASDRLFQVFRAALRVISAPEANMPLREAFYNICYRYLARINAKSDGPLRRSHIIQLVKAMGEKTIDMICDDALGATPSCRVSALLLLDVLSALAELDQSVYLMDSMIRANFLQVMVESIEVIPVELRETSAQGKEGLPSTSPHTYYFVTQMYLFYSRSTTLSFP